MAKFFRCTNNSTVAIVTEEVYGKMQEREKLYRDHERAGMPMPVLLPIVPVFTFSRNDHPSLCNMTGNVALMERLLRSHQVQDASFYVPFSNHIEWGSDESAKYELRFRTTLQEAIEAFGLRIPGEQE